MDEASTPFRHGVASGDPTGDAVVIWTRVTASDAVGGAGGVVARARRRWSGLATHGQRRGVAGPRLDRRGRRRRPRARAPVPLRLRGARGVIGGRADPDAAAGRGHPAPPRPGLVREVQRRVLQRVRPGRRARRPRRGHPPGRLHLRGVEHAAQDPDAGRRHRPAVRPAPRVPDARRLPAPLRAVPRGSRRAGDARRAPRHRHHRRPRARRRRVARGRRQPRRGPRRAVEPATRRRLPSPFRVAPDPAARPRRSEPRLPDRPVRRAWPTCS